MAGDYTVRNWIVKRGRDGEFELAWKEFARWLVSQGALKSASRLFKDDLDPAHYISIESWDSETARATIQSGVPFGKQSYKLQQLTIDSSSSSFRLVAEEAL